MDSSVSVLLMGFDCILIAVDNDSYSYLNPGSVFIFSTISFKASATAALNQNPSLAKLMAGWTRASHGNLPYSFQALYWP